MSNNNSFGGKLKKVLASMCSLFVGASGVSQATKPGTNMPTKPKLGKDANLFGFFGWRLESKVGDAKKEKSWLVSKDDIRYQLFGKVDGVEFNVGFGCGDFLCNFNIWVDGDAPVVNVSIPKGILFDVMRHFELDYFLSDDAARNNGTELSCANKSVNNSAVDGVFLRFILWAFFCSDDTIKPDDTSVDELKEAIFESAVKVNNPGDNRDNFVEKTVEVTKDEKNTEEKKYYVLKPGYFLENFSKRAREVYKKAFGCNLADMDDVVNFIAQLNGKITQLDNEKKDLKNQKHIGKYLLGALGSFAVGGILTEGAHRFLGAKRSGSSEVNKGKPSINKVNKGKPSSNKKGGQKAKKNLKKRRG